MLKRKLHGISTHGTIPLTVAAVMGGGQTYQQKVLSYSPIAYWPLNETSGTTAADVSGNGLDGSYTGVTLANAAGPAGDGSAPHFDGANDYVDLYSAGLNTAFDGTEGTVAVWAKVENAGVWTDGAQRFLMIVRSDGSNEIRLDKTAINNQIQLSYEANADQDQRLPSLSVTAWFHVALTWSDTSDQADYFINGASKTPISTIGTWSGALSSANVVVGAFSTVPAAVWQGWLAHATLWDRAMTAGEILELATV